MIDPRSVPVRISHLKAMSQSPAHYVAAVQDQREETLSMRIGSGTHALVFGTPKVVVYRGGEFPDTKGKLKTFTDVRNGACWEDFQQRHTGCVILSETEYARSEAMARALTSDLAADSLLFAPGAKHEQEITWTLEGRACRGRVDAITPTALPDLKCVKDSGPLWFPRQALQLRWPAQVVWYADGCEAAGLGWRHPHLVAVENTPPFAVTVWRLDDAAIKDGRRLYRGWFERVLDCERTNSWPGYTSNVLTFSAVDCYHSSKESD